MNEGLEKEHLEMYLSGQDVLFIFTKVLEWARIKYHIPLRLPSAWFRAAAVGMQGLAGKKHTFLVEWYTAA